MSDLVGDTTHLHRTTVPFSASHKIVGHEIHGSFLLSDATGFSSVASSRASVKIVSDSLSCKIIGPAAADKAVSTAVAILPETASNPTAFEHILSIGGFAYLEHSVYNSPGSVPVAFAAEAAHQIKPKPLVGSPPKVVYYHRVLGGDGKSVSHLVVQGLLEVDGVGFVKSW
ncbi:hypothetical protein A4X09_0g7110 [Tilletia walkeri]|uniref:Uncharacterized protein n=4 Tax=Tilletia TaxID=13289 RepID=A0A8X7N2I1_9BASI|nr:hypothetical protein A4X06_0g8791 [Tilletia controversa]KAE8241366.1 hypothetical protein A4X13_0g7446 [Tilletia indica]KAE8245072.1 hypothetical protein A4X03_0g7507 [Tilletia caries]KAE8263889.1 hypothetical protein A4X09_0g7110 [Tilletia walkeri]